MDILEPKKSSMYYIIMTDTCHYTLVQTHRVFDDETQPVCTGAKLNLRDKVLDGTERNSSIALPGKVGHKGIMPLKVCVPAWGDLVRSFMAVVPRRVPGVRVCVQGLYSFNLASGGLLMRPSLCDLWNEDCHQVFDIPH